MTLDRIRTIRINMARATALGLLAAGLAIGGTAHASCSDPGAGTNREISFPEQHHRFAHDDIVGTWLVNYGPVGMAFIQWHSDGTEWENITHPSIGGNICMGSWEQTGARTFFRNHFGWIFDSTGTIAGYFNETETDTLSKDGNSYTGTNVTIFYDMSGKPVPAPGAPAPAPAGGYPGTATATRIAP